MTLATSNYEGASYKKLHLSRPVGSFLFFSKAILALAMTIGIFIYFGFKVHTLRTDALERRVLGRVGLDETTVAPPPRIPVPPPTAPLPVPLLVLPVPVVPTPVVVPVVPVVPTTLEPVIPVVPVVPEPVVPVVPVPEDVALPLFRRTYLKAQKQD